MALEKAAKRGHDGNNQHGGRQGDKADGDFGIAALRGQRIRAGNHQNHQKQPDAAQHGQGRAQDGAGVAVAAQRNAFGYQARDGHRDTGGRDGQKHGVGGIDQLIQAQAFHADSIGQRDAEEHANHLGQQSGNAQNRNPAQKAVFLLAHSSSIQ